MKFSACSLGVPFSVRYEVERMISIGALTRCEVSSHGFWRLLCKLSKVEGHLVLDRMYLLASEQSNYRITTLRALEYVIQSISTFRLGNYAVYQPECKVFKEKTEKITHKTSQSPVAPLLVRKLVVTPTRVVPCPSELGTDNRVLRKYREFAELFIRVSFVDEDGDSISYQNSCDCTPSCVDTYATESTLQAKTLCFWPSQYFNCENIPAGSTTNIRLLGPRRV